MQQRQIQQKQIKQQEIQRVEFSSRQFTRPHNEHQHSMTLSTPQRDDRQFNIPDSTIISDEARPFRLPFKWLRTWVFSLIALLALPIGLALIMLGNSMESEGKTWTETTATVSRYNESGVRFRLEAGDTETIGFELDDFVTVEGDTFIFAGSACDLVSRFIIPEENGAEFTIWVNPAAPSELSCVPISPESGSMMMILGGLLVAFAAWRLVRTINAAATAKA